MMPMLVVRAAAHKKGQQKLSRLGGKCASGRPVHTGVIKSSLSSRFDTFLTKSPVFIQIPGVATVGNIASSLCLRGIDQGKDV
jgi:hypothetical protein